MTAEPQLFRINPENRESEKIAEVEFASLGFQERRDIQEWVAANPEILGDDLLIIGKEFSGFDKVSDRLDLLAVDADGKLVVIELKRDDSGTDAHWQAIKYASYLQRASVEDLVRMFADYGEVSEEHAASQILQHLNADDLNALNKDQRIILASHRFAPEVTSAALWLNEKAPGEDLITCVQLIPYRDVQTESLYVQAHTIIPVPGIDDYLVVIDGSSIDSRPLRTGASKLAQTFARNRGDDITRFLRRISDRTLDGLPSHLKPERTSRWAGGDPSLRYWHLWYSRPFWGNWRAHYHINLSPDSDGREITWKANIGFSDYRNEIADLESKLADLNVYEDQWWEDRSGELGVTRLSDDLDDAFAATLVETLGRFIEVVTPRIDDIVDTSNEEDA
ncbi:MAG: endonuclease NucS [Chloroflexota bacterium]|nr:endonuclease NucS [Chloroflexota bacterium]MDE2903761.1 endonuclease NucS [Chloroflexota bacterium]